MRVRLTARDVSRLPPSRTAYRDEVLRGLVLRVWPSGGRSFAVEYSHAGRPRRFTLGAAPPLTLAEARARARAVLAEVLAGRDPQAEKVYRSGHSVTVAELSRRCLESLDLRPATAEEYARLTAVEILPVIGERGAASLTRGEVRELFRALAARAPYVANRAFALLRRVFSWGVAEDVLPASPFVGLRPPAQERPSDRVLTVKELRLLLLALDDLPGQYSDAARLLLLTGARREMVVGLRAQELELDGPEPRWTVPAERMKGGRAHVVPLSGPAVAVLRRRLALADADVVFPPARTAQAPAMVWSSRYVARLTGRMEELLWVDLYGPWQPEPRPSQEHPREPVPRWTIHNLRHAVATHLREDLGVASEVVSRILGHAPPGAAVSRVYNRAELLPERRAALVAWADWLDAVRAGQRRATVLPIAR